MIDRGARPITALEYSSADWWVSAPVWKDLFTSEWRKTLDQDFLTTVIKHTAGQYTIFLADCDSSLSRYNHQIVPLDMKGCISHFLKWQIHPFISKGTKCSHLTQGYKWFVLAQCKRRTFVWHLYDVGQRPTWPTLYKCYINVLYLLALYHRPLRSKSDTLPNILPSCTGHFTTASVD